MALTASLALVAIASRAHRPGGGSGTARAHPPALIADYISTLALVVIPIGAILVLWGLTYRRREQVRAGRTHWRHTLISLIVLSLVLGGAIWTTTTLRRGTSPHVARTIPSASAPTHGSNHRTAKGRPFYRPHFRWLPVLVLGSIALGLAVTAGVAVVQRRRYGEAEDEQALAAALDEVLADTLDDLRAESDPRRAVIRAYARMERTFAAYGVPREQSEAPLEYLARVLDSIQVSAFSVRRLTQLFERAKFSPHEIDSSMKDDAIEALAGLRAELEHGREAAA
jgi:uncharacterized protein DUF4129